MSSFMSYQRGYSRSRKCQFCYFTPKTGHSLYEVRSCWTPNLRTDTKIGRDYAGDPTVNIYVICGDCLKGYFSSCHPTGRDLSGYMIVSCIRLEGFPSEWHFKRAK